MGYRTYITLTVPGKPQTVGTFKDMPTSIYLLDNYCLGKVYFNDLPNELEELLEEEGDLYLREDKDDDGEIYAFALQRICQTINMKQVFLADDALYALDPWYHVDVNEILTVLNQAIAQGIINENTIVSFECY